MPNVRIAFSQFTIAGGPHTEPWHEAVRDHSLIAEMTSEPSPPSPAQARERKPLTPAAKRALAEAEARRQAGEAGARPAAPEFQGPKGPEPTRYGDWENKGIASDF
jgi:hypothetical protein